MAIALILGFFVLLDLAMMLLAGGASVSMGSLVTFAMVIAIGVGVLVGVRNLLDGET